MFNKKKPEVQEKRQLKSFYELFNAAIDKNVYGDKAQFEAMVERQHKKHSLTDIQYNKLKARIDKLPNDDKLKKTDEAKSMIKNTFNDLATGLMAKAATKPKKFKPVSLLGEEAFSMKTLTEGSTVSWEGVPVEIPPVSKEEAKKIRADHKAEIAKQRKIFNEVNNQRASISLEEVKENLARKDAGKPPKAHKPHVNSPSQAEAKRLAKNEAARKAYHEKKALEASKTTKKK